MEQKPIIITQPKIPTGKKLVLYDMKKNWRILKPIFLSKPVQDVLDKSFSAEFEDWKREDPPYLYGKGRYDNRRVRKHSKRWFMAMGQCHALAPVCCAVGMILLPELKWKIRRGDLHSVAVGYGSKEIVIMDILCGEHNTAEGIWNFSHKATKAKVRKYNKIVMEMVEKAEKLHATDDSQKNRPPHS